MTLRETYEVDENEEVFDMIIQKIQDLLQSLNWNKIDLKARNGERYIEVSLFANRKTEEVVEMLEFFGNVAELAIGSYGLIYMLDEGDSNGKEKENEFQVCSISRGRLH